MKRVIEKRDKVLEILADKLAGFYLAGGTALSLFYFQHRESYDLDFFTKEFSREKIEKIMAHLYNVMGLKMKLEGEEQRKDRAQMLRYSLAIDKSHSLKIDFIEDVYKLIKPFKTVNGVWVLSIEDIYLRKIFAVCGSREMVDSAGRKMFVGGRQEAKDFFDLYFLSNTFMPLSKFAVKYCNQAQMESIIVWYRTYDRMQMKIGLTDIATDKNIDYRDMERHFKSEVEQIVKQEF